MHITISFYYILYYLTFLLIVPILNVLVFFDYEDGSLQKEPWNINELKS